MTVGLRAAAVVAAVLAGAASARAADYPAHPITLVVPYAAGGGNDVIARIVAERMSASLGQSIVIENRGGAGGTIATRQVAKAAPDGYTLLIATSSLAINPSLYPNVGYDPRKDFAPIGLIASSSNVVLVHPSVPAHSIAELIALAKQRARQARLRLDRHRIERASRRRAVRRHGRRQAHPRALQGLRPGAERSDRRPRRDHVQHDGERRRPRPRRQQGARAGGDRRQRARRFSRTCRPSRKRACPATRRCCTTASSRRPARRGRWSRSSTPRSTRRWPATR